MLAEQDGVQEARRAGDLVDAELRGHEQLPGVALLLFGRQRGVFEVLSPAVVAGSLAALDLVAGGSAARERLHENAALFRLRMTEQGFDLLPGEHPVVPVMFGDVITAQHMAAATFVHGVYVIAFGHPVVPHGSARIRVQVSATHTVADIETCVRAFTSARSIVGTR